MLALYYVLWDLFEMANNHLGDYFTKRVLRYAHGVTQEFSTITYACSFDIGIMKITMSGVEFEAYNWFQASQSINTSSTATLI